MTFNTSTESTPRTWRRALGARALVTGLAGATLALTGCLVEADLAESDMHDSDEEWALLAAGDLDDGFQTQYVSRVWAFAWAQQSTGTFVASSSYSRNSSGDFFGQGVNNTIEQTGTGQYRVHFPGIGVFMGGNVQVTAYGSSSHRCKVQSWSMSGAGGINAYVNCFTAAGAPVNTQFSIAYVRKSGTGATSEAYLWANEPESASYTPSASYQFNSSGAQNSISRTGEGVYAVTLPNQTAASGTVEVTAHGAGSDYCKVASWTQSGAGVIVNVRCFDATGSPSDSRFTLNFASAAHINGGNSYSYAWANNATSAAYTPHLSYQKGYIGGDVGDIATDITAGRVSTGLYYVDLPAMSATGSNVQVTAYGTGSEHCKVSGWSGGTYDTTAQIRCFDADGDPTDTRFVIVYTGDKALWL